MTAVIDTTPLDRPAWLAWRRQGIGGSDIPVIAGYSTWTSPADIWADKLGIADERPTTERMRWGQVLEDPALDEWANTNDIEIVARQPRVHDPDHPWRRVTPDRLTPDTAIDGKVTSQAPWTDGPPMAYVAQVTWQMGLSEREKGQLVVLHQGVEQRTYDIPWSPKFFAALAAKADEFWQLVLDARHPDDAIEADDRILTLARQLDQASTQRRALEKEEDRLKAELRLALAGHPSAHIRGKDIVTDRTSDRAGIDTAALIDAYASLTDTDPDTVRASFTTSTPSRTLRTTKHLKELAP